MTIANLTDILQPAMQKGYGIAGVVVLGWEDACAYVDAAEAVQCPLILQAGPGARAHMPVNVIGPMMRYLAEQASVPVAVHLDHGYALDECVAGLDYGFTSIMFDGSKLPIQENIEITARIAEQAHKAGASVEGEVGYVGYADGAKSNGTDPAEAQMFDQQSGADALAVSIGNVHLQTEKSAGIDFDLIDQIEVVTNLPLVVHGGSGIPNDVRQKLASSTRVSKFNLGTELRMAFGAALRQSIKDQPETFDRNNLLKPVIAPVSATTQNALENLFGNQKLT